MYKLITFEESVRIAPSMFGLKLEKAALAILREQHERSIHPDHGVIISLHNPKIKSAGKVIHGDGAAYFDVEFDALVFDPQINEIVDGEVTEIVEFGAFVRLGPVDGLVHVSQVANDFLSYDKRTQSLIGRQTKKTLKKGDSTRAKIATVSLKESILATKIALTMRPEGLGKMTPPVKMKKAKKKEKKAETETEAKEAGEEAEAKKAGKGA